MLNVDNPLKWLLAQLPSYLTSEQHTELMVRFDQQKNLYAIAIKIREVERRIKHYALWPERYDPKNLPRWEEKLVKLKAQLDKMEQVL